MRLFVLMGVSGSGKSTVGEALAPLVHGVYLDGDDFHPPENVAKMSRGEPLTDADRGPWLEKVGQVMRKRSGLVIAGCSALKRSYRDAIRAAADEPVCFIHLTGSEAVLTQRMKARKHHFMPASLLKSQLATLEPPGEDEDAVSVGIDAPVEEVAAEIVSDLRGAGHLDEEA